MSGTIGATLVNKTRSQMGLAGNLRAKSKKDRASAQGKSASKISKTASSPGKTMFAKDLTEIEDSLRRVRRLLYVNANEMDHMAERVAKNQFPHTPGQEGLQMCG